MIDELNAVFHSCIVFSSNIRISCFHHMCKNGSEINNYYNRRSAYTISVFSSLVTKKGG